MVAIIWPLNTAPGLRDQDGAGRLINVYAEPRQNQQGTVWRRAPGCVAFTNIYPGVISFTATATATFVGVNPQGALAATGTAVPAFVGST